MDKFLKSYKNHLKFEVNASAHTIRAYVSDINDFYSFLKDYKYLKSEEEFKPDEIKHTTIRSYIGSMLERKLERVSINRRLSSLRTFFDFLIREGHSENNPAKQTMSPKMPYKTADFMSLDDVLYILDSSAKVQGPFGIRNRNIFEILYSTGIRVGELVTLDLEDIDLNEKIIYVRGKGRKDRIVPFGGKCKEALNSYLEVRNELFKKNKKPQKGDDRALFLNKTGRRLTTDGVRLILKTFLKKISLHRKVTPHTFRHTAASHLLDSGADMMVVKELLGHKDLSTTQKYTHVTVDKLIREYDKAHPRGKLNARKE
ncbi:tyrosine-type recombinase/integrase [bacterium]|nr:tyrosine-type recombinase/integrase [bacterium]